MIHVTDHALVRFLERSGALDVEQLRALIASSLERGRKAAERAGAVGEFAIVVDGLRYVIDNGILVTVLDESMQRRRR
ncbi:hypothetical protein [Bosea sp. TAB14]|uniref:hypothetical protein n=1 Tax=Bosea sp. TAB14 TaxID=3237481 RepID=UPI003F90DA5D